MPNRTQDNQFLSTTMEEDFLDNFHLVYENDNDTKKLKFFCPLIDANSLNYDGLIVALRDAAGHYCLSRRTWNEYVNKPMQLSHLVREKFRRTETNKGELGELLLFSFLESDLKAPKLLTKMELKTNPNMYFNGADGVHYLKLANGDFQLIFGESKAYEDLGDGISAAIGSIFKFKNDAIKDDESGQVRGITFEKGLLNAHLTAETFSEQECAFLKSLIYPKATQGFCVDTAFAVFVLYNIQIPDEQKSKSNIEFRSWLFDGLKKAITELLPSILKEISDKQLSGHSFYFYIVPFENMEENRDIVLRGTIE